MVLFLGALLSCKQGSTTPKEEEVQEEVVEEIIADRSKDFPVDIAAVFTAHGGIQAFDKQKTLIFELAKPDGNEKHTTDLNTRHARIETDMEKKLGLYKKILRVLKGIHVFIII